MGDSGAIRLPGQGARALLRVPYGQGGLRISVLCQLTPKTCYPLGESTSFPQDPLMTVSAIADFRDENIATKGS